MEYPGQCISVDNFESAMAGFTAQLKGVLTNKQYCIATIYIDHNGNLSYAFLQEYASSKSTLKRMLKFKQYARKAGVEIEQYHADNGGFADKAFIYHVKEKVQTITYCGVNAHHKDIKVEKWI